MQTEFYFHKTIKINSKFSINKYGRRRENNIMYDLQFGLFCKFVYGRKYYPWTSMNNSKRRKVYIK